MLLRLIAHFLVGSPPSSHSRTSLLKVHDLASISLLLDRAVVNGGVSVIVDVLLSYGMNLEVFIILEHGVPVEDRHLL